MFALAFKPSTVACAFALTLLVVAPAAAQQQPISGGTSGGVQGRDVSAGTSGTGTTDGTRIGTGGTADATATDGGRVSTNVDSTVNDRRAMTRSSADARDEDERARSRTRTTVRQGEIVRSRTMSRYKERGEPAVREVMRTTTTADGTTTNTKGSTKPKR